jgi:signal transduction histidine kinase/CheY-like chemotaxis protein
VQRTTRTVLVEGKKQHWYRYRIQPIFGTRDKDEDDYYPAVQGLSVVGTNITDMVEAENELRRVAEERIKLLVSETAARETFKLKTEYFTHISHETRTPLAGIMAIAEVLLSDSTLSDPHRNLVQQLLRSGEILLEMIGMVLDMRKLEVGQLKLERTTFHTADLIADAKLLAVLAKRKGLDYIEDIGSYDPGPLRGDRGRLRQVIANGLSNAAKFTDTGSVTLRVRQTAETAAFIRLRFDIIDTGCGIASSVLPTLFHPFQQADLSTARRYGGAGLGLAISRELISLMGGTVDLQSVEGQGTTMTVEIELEKDLSSASGEAADPDVAAREPVTDSSGRHNSNLEANASSRKPESVRILLAEDNKLVRDLYVRILRQRGFSIVAVADGQQAVDAVHSEGQFDLIFMDGQMPVKDGYQATGEIRASTSPTIARIKIVALTASAFEGDRDRCLAAGMNDYLSKPVKADTLEQMVWQHVK